MLLDSTRSKNPQDVSFHVEMAGFEMTGFRLAYRLCTRLVWSWKKRSIESSLFPTFSSSSSSTSFIVSCNRAGRSSPSPSLCRFFSSSSSPLSFPSPSPSLSSPSSLSLSQKVKEEVDALPFLSFQGRILVPQTPEEAHVAIDLLKSDPDFEKGLGFDTEWQPELISGAPKNPIAVIQLATENLVVIFHFVKIPFPEPLGQLLEDPHVLKIGLALTSDLHRIKKCFHLIPNGFVDVATEAHRVGHHHAGLQSLSRRLLKMNVDKSQSVSNWGHSPLSEKQVNYAATDAYVTQKLYHILKRLPDSGGPPTHRQCLECGWISPSEAEEEIFSHFEKTKHKGVRFLYHCPSCTRFFATGMGLEEHIKAKHLIN